jgi:hypothetical protein
MRGLIPIVAAALIAALTGPSAHRAIAGTRSQAQESAAAPQTPNAAAPQGQQSSAASQVVDRIIARENQLVASLQKYRPRIEIYLQGLRADRELGTVPTQDAYFLGRLQFQKVFGESSFLPEPSLISRVLGHMKDPLLLSPSRRYHVQALGYGVVMDDRLLDREHYDFKFVRREFLGDVRCLVFDVMPKQHAGAGRFMGRIWADDRDFNVVRFNGTYAPAPRFGSYYHIDSWRQNLQPGIWLPVYVYSEESDPHHGVPTFRFRAQTRLWGYDLKGAGHQEELTQVLVDAPSAVHDSSDAASDLSPTQSRREWEREAETNVLDRLEKAGLIAPAGEVSKVLETVVNNLVITNHLDNLPPVHCRVMLTYPLESYSIGYTIVLSRGLIDVLPDEVNLAMVLAHELAHISLGHPMDSRYAFNDRMIIRDEDILSRLGFDLSSQDEAAADKKGIEFLKNSPYKDKLNSAGLFLRALAAQAPRTPKLFGARLGNQLVRHHELIRESELISGAPELKPRQTDQIAALPLGSRIRVDAWSGRVYLMKTKAVPLIAANEKMPFQITPLFPSEKYYAEAEREMAGHAETDSSKPAPQ